MGMNTPLVKRTPGGEPPACVGIPRPARRLAVVWPSSGCPLAAVSGRQPRNSSTGTLQLASRALVVEPMIMLRMREWP